MNSNGKRSFVFKRGRIVMGYQYFLRQVEFLCISRLNLKIKDGVHLNSAFILLKKLATIGNLIVDL